ncbi:MAG TPA: response regulator transcription factor [Bryobacteraceae bacterium]|jgi:two-component system KDP operon response regulator KdpE|nr:response regulator transcription factor [Bryobacteraceae bacterium]
MPLGTEFHSASLNQATVQPHRTEGRLLIVSEDAPMRRTLHSTLFNLGFDIAEVSSGEEALAICRILQYDAILLDAGLAGTNSIEIYTELRRLLPRVSILMLTASGEPERTVEAFETGADTWITRPFQMRELTARLRSVLRRTVVPEPRTSQAIVIGILSLNSARRLVQKSGQRIHLTPKEFDLLHCLMTHPGIPVSYNRLIHALWGEDYATQMDGLRTLVRQLRRKIEDDPAAPRYVLTESRIGYRFADPEDWLDEQSSVRH